MSEELHLLTAIMGTRPLTRSMRSFWVKSKNPLSDSKRSLRFFCRHIGGRNLYSTALNARRLNARAIQLRRGEDYRMRRRPFAGIAL